MSSPVSWKEIVLLMNNNNKKKHSLNYVNSPSPDTLSSNNEEVCSLT